VGDVGMKLLRVIMTLAFLGATSALALSTADRPGSCAVASGFSPLDQNALAAAELCLKDATAGKDKALALNLKARALLWSGSRDWQAMIDAATGALKSNPKDDWPRLVRGQAYLRAGQLDLALADLTAAKKSKRVKSLEGPNAQMEWVAAQMAKGDWKKAQAESLVLFAALPYEVRVWGIAYATSARAGDKAKASELISKVTTWPINSDGGHIVWMYLGQLSPEDAIVRALGSGYERASGRLCTTHFMIGELYMLRGDKVAAKKHFEAAIATGTAAYPEFVVSQVELRKL
jgi:tetratricopeptide (TPR) repeat protein